MGELTKKAYKAELRRMQRELVELQEGIRAEGSRLVVLFEGRDTAGKGGTISRIVEELNPRYCHVIALGVPTEVEKGQWYFQRYAEHLPTAGHIALFDRSWYNRAGVERVMGFATPEQVESFLRAAPEQERIWAEDGIVLVKYWLEVGPDVQEQRFRERAEDETKRWKLSPMDLEARSRYDDYSAARDEMLVRTDTAEAPWFVVDADDQRRARLNLIQHLLDHVPARRESPVVRFPARRRKGAAAASDPPASIRRVPERW
jgi:polyphosphate kinase 2